MPSDDWSLYRTIAKSAGVAFSGRLLELGISFVGAAIVARLIGPSDFGSITIGKTLLSTIGSIVLLGLTTGITRYVPRYNNASDKRGVLVASFQIVVPLSIIVAVGLFVASEWLAAAVFSDQAVAPVIGIFALAIPLSAVTDLGIAASKGYTDSLPQVYIKNLSIPITRLTLAAIVLLVAPSAPGIAWAYVLAYVASATLSLYYLYTKTDLFRRLKYTPPYRELLSFSAPLVLSVLMAQFLSDIDTFMLGYFGETADVGIYGAIYPLASLMMLFNTSINHLSLPVISELHSDDRLEGMNRMFRVITKWIVLSTLPVFLVFLLFPRQAIFLTYGSEYVAGDFALSILVLGFLANIAVGPAQQTLSSIADTHIIMYVSVFVAALNTVLNIALIPGYSYLGAAVATSISYAVLQGLYLVQLYRRTGIHPFTRSLLKPVLAATTAAFAAYAALDALVEITLFVVVPACLAFAPVYIFIILRFGGIEREEVDLIMDLEDKFDIDLSTLKRIANRIMD
jgi:O-antigen/teichoic acid export membrane protein